MLRKELLLCVGALCLCATSSQPVSCTDKAQCTVGHYCDVNTKICRNCLSCQDLKRELPTTSDACIKSVALCGDCIKGWEKDQLGDVNAACVLSVPEGTPNYVWWLIGIGILVFLALMVAIIIYIWVNPNIFELLKLRGNSQGGTVSTDIRTVTRATAPPSYTPNYDIPYSSVRTSESPCPPHHEAENVNADFNSGGNSQGGPVRPAPEAPPPYSPNYNIPFSSNGSNVSPHHDAGDISGDLNSGEEGPFLKCRVGGRLQDARESSTNQAATVYNIPIYDREDLPSSPEPPTVTEVTDNLPIHEEVTMDSLWTPEGPSNGDINANVSEHSTSDEGTTTVSLPAMLAIAKDTTLVEHPAPKRMRIRSTTDNNRKGDGNPSADSSSGNFSGGQSSQPYNFITQITNVVQINRTS